MYRSFIFMTSFVLVIGSYVKRNNYGTSFDVVNFEKAKLPEISDLEVYVHSLQRIIEFCSRNKSDLDLNLEFGLFLMSVNLKYVLKKKRNSLPKDLDIILEKLVKDNDDLFDYFTYMFNKDQNPKDRSNKMITSLFLNETKWINRILEYDTRSTIFGNDDQFQVNERYGSIDEYIEDLNNIDSWVPTPGLSDKCFTSLAQNPDYNLMSTSRCTLNEPCYNMIKKGSNFGYAMSHRLLLLVNARHGRGCYIFSNEKDRELAKNFCKMAYDEIKFVIEKRYDIIDLILELITLCALDGHPDFLRKDWMANSLRFQNNVGCFGVTVPTQFDVESTKHYEGSRKWTLSKKDQRIRGGYCNGHVTSVAAAALSAAIRYILETYY